MHMHLASAKRFQPNIHLPCMAHSYFLFKCFADRLASLLILVFLSPLLIGVALLVYFCIGSPVLFLQPRPGYRKQIFRLIKFRSMSNRVDSTGSLLPDRERLTRIGAVLRATSIDELPELLNILCGEMSFVGPRPLLVQYLPLYSCEQIRRHNVKPGLTGLAQISGRNALSWEDKFNLDIWYVDHQSFLLDLRILLITVWKVVRREGISSSGEATMAPFIGTPAADQ